MELLICLLIVVTIVCLMFSMWKKPMHRYGFEGFAYSNRYTFIKFYTHWCGYCKKLAPEWKKLKEKYKHKIGFEEYDCDIQKNMCSQHDIKGYPTIKIRDNVTGNFLQYDGPREYSAMAAYIDTVIGR